MTDVAVRVGACDDPRRNHMGSLSVHLLGRPRLRQDGVALPGPRGHKAWGLLAYLICAERPPTRDELVTLLFAEADDPAGALRWNLSALRRALPGAELEGDPVRVHLPSGTTTDVRTVAAGRWPEVVVVEDLERELLEGLRFDASPAFDLWLVTERRHLGALAEAALREAALARLAGGDAAAAVGLAGRLVRLNPFDETFQALLVRSLAATGDGIGAARQVARCRELLLRELGVEPSPAVAEAARVPVTSTTAAAVSGRAAAGAQLEAGEAAIAAGALDAGLQCLRRAVADAAAARATDVRARALVALGSALVHAARGRDEEAAAALHEALAVAADRELPTLAAAASRELGYVEFLRGRYEGAQAWLAQAAGHAGDDVAERGRIGSVLGSVLTDTADYPTAIATLRTALNLSEAGGDTRRVAYTRSMLGRAHLLRGDLAAAGEELDRSLDQARADGWVAFTPWPDALRAEVDLQTGRLDAAEARLDHALALGCQLNDPCWEGISARGLGLVAAARGDVAGAVDRLSDARGRCARLPDAYLWVEAYTLEALCAVAVAHELASAGTWLAQLDRIAARCGMRDLEVRALLHRAGLGDPAAHEAARIRAADVDSPALAQQLDASAAAA